MKKQNFKKALPYLIITFFFVGSVAVIAGVTGGVNYYPSYHSYQGTSMQTKDVNNKVHAINNSSTKDYFVPNKTAEEWTAFADNLPPQVTLDAVDCADINFTAGSDCKYNGYVYPTVQVGSQIWFNEDLQTTQKPDGSVMAQWPPSVASASSTMFTCDTNVSSCIDYLYQWDAALNGTTGFTGASSTPVIQGICPAGWHIPSDPEINALKTAVGSCYNSTNNAFNAYCLDNSFNFYIKTPLSGWRKGTDGIYYNSGGVVFLRSATYDTNDGGKFHAHAMTVTPDGSSVQYGNYSKSDGLSVRCVKD